MANLARIPTDSNSNGEFLNEWSIGAAGFILVWQYDFFVDCGMAEHLESKVAHLDRDLFANN
jgi:hypothetical protein